MLRQVLFVLIFLRLLWPPGLCMCHLFDSAPAHHHDQDDHHPGCPASKAAAVALCSMKQESPRLSAAPDLLATIPDAPPVSRSAEFIFADFSLADTSPSGQPLYLTLRALLI